MSAILLTVSVSAMVTLSLKKLIVVELLSESSMVFWTIGKNNSKVSLTNRLALSANSGRIMPLLTVTTAAALSYISPSNCVRRLSIQNLVKNWFLTEGTSSESAAFGSI